MPGGNISSTRVVAILMVAIRRKLLVSCETLKKEFFFPVIEVEAVSGILLLVSSIAYSV
jgi:hypothetical protein